MPVRLYPLLLFALGGVNVFLLDSMPQMVLLGILLIGMGCIVLLWQMMKRPVRAGPAASASGLSAGRAPGVTDELARLSGLRDRGQLSQTEFESLKRKLID